MNILNTIIEYKRSEVKKRKSGAGILELEKSAYFKREGLSLKQALQKEGQTGLIAEFKRRSPSKGIINDKANVLDVTRAYTERGACGLSVLTDENFFGGSDNDLVEARMNSIPILRKDFIIDEYQIIEAKAIGADVILLIAACLTPAQVKEFSATAKQIGLEVLLELHDEDELEQVCREVDIIGINNRDLKNFDVNIEQSLKIAERIPAYKIKIAESGINSVEDILLLRTNGFRGFLIGELFMKQADPATAFTEFANALRLAMADAKGRNSGRIHEQNAGK